MEPLDHMVDVAPVGRGLAAGEDAMLVAVFDGAAQVRGDDAVAAPKFEWLPLGADDYPGDIAVAGQPARPGGRYLGAEPGGARSGTGRGVDQVREGDGDDHMRLDRAQD